ncbi:MAG: ribonuclease R [Bacteroidales bacterium]|nr:ribonuclease R [Candidatus Liminaster caballi]
MGKSSQAKLLERITEWFGQHPNNSYNYLQISQELGIFGRANRADVYEMLTLLAAQGYLREVSVGRYTLSQRQSEELEGTFDRRHNGLHQVRVDGYEEPFTVYDGDDMQALTGDRVRLHKIVGGKGRSRSMGGPKARVVEVIERVQHRYVGVLQKNGKYAFVTPDNRSLDKDIYIPNELLGKAHHGDKVVVDFERWPAFSKNPVGRIVDVLGKNGENNAEMHAILAEYGLPYRYPQNVVRAANHIADGCTEEEIARREDLREVVTFTIDPADAKDFDDALSLRKLDNGHWEAGVHIADVTFYVRQDSVIDKEAYSRATSVYLVDRTIPMLPEKLCNELCSLRQDEEKLCFSCLFEMDDDANVLKSRIVRTCIRSNRRFTYEEAQQIIETGQGDYAAEVLQLDRLAKQLRARRFAEGAIAFDRAEVKFIIDQQGKPTDVFFKVAKDSNKLVEEFMLLANRCVAEAIGKVAKKGEKGKKTAKAKTFVYRVHDQPSSDKLENLASLASRFGHKLKAQGNNREISQSINALMKDIHDRPEENMLSQLAIRSMAKAVYTTENIGHYGLAFQYYTHFTSPIRRYPDCMVHRLLDRYLNEGGRSVPASQYEEYCKHCSDMEQLAASAERASIKYKQAEYLNDRLGMVFDGVISGVSEWGFYVEIKENMCEGLVPARDLKDDHYVYDERNFCLIGRRTHRRFTLGDNVRIQVASVNMERRTVDFTLCKFLISVQKS